MRSIGVVGFVFATTILALGACGDDDPAPAVTPDGGATSGSSSGSSGSSSSSGTPGGDDDDDNDNPDAGDKPIVVGDGSLGAACNVDGDCKAKACSTGHKCVPAKSCKGSTGTTPGVDTCGPAEPGNDSCCKSLTLPTTKTRTLDKYEITSGRVRAFITALKADNAGSLRKFVADFAKANPTSQLGKMAADFPKYVEILPDDDKTDSDGTLLPLWLGAFPQDPINTLDGCFVNADGFGAATYWQEPDVLKVFGIGVNEDGKRAYTAAQLDTKPANCMPPVLLAAFCAWDGGELARTSDYREAWGREKVTLAGKPLSVPWAGATFPKVGEFNWRNGHGAACPDLSPAGPATWPAANCDPTPTTPFFTFPASTKLKEDDSPSIGAPGRFPKDVTKLVSEDGGEGWFDLGGNLLEAMWPNTARPVAAAQQGYCDTAHEAGTGATLCKRAGSANNGKFLYTGQPPSIVLQGYSFEGHTDASGAYLGAATDDETKLPGARPAHFQYGKVGGRCARVK